MSRPVLAVYDDSPDYVNRFLGYLAKIKDFPFDPHGFTEMDSLERYIASHEIGVLVISMEDAPGKTRDEEMMLEHRMEDCISEVGERCIYLGERRNSRCRLKHVDKYQAVSDVVDEILACCRESGWYEPVQDRRKTKIIGIYLPVFSVGDVDRILQTAAIEAAKAKTLFISLRRFTGLDRKLGCTAGLSDEIYYFKTNRDKIREALKSDIKPFMNMDVLICSVNQEDLDEINDWTDFLNCLAGAGGYESIVLDMGEAFRSLAEAFDMCDIVYVPWQGKPEDDEFLAEFRRYFIIMEFDRLLEKVNVIN
ncbi:MAG: hypothetical protein IJM53_05040 [Lachnospiraceae bacterium]|nr:hypothetical protein [Lachnospiraceae bacterium]